MTGWSLNGKGGPLASTPVAPAEPSQLRGSPCLPSVTDPPSPLPALRPSPPLGVPEDSPVGLLHTGAQAQTMPSLLSSRPFQV